MKRTRIKPMSAKRRRENAERRRVLHETFGQFPPCMLCGPLRAFGVETGCDGRATDAHEVLTRSRGGSITDVENIVPVGRDCHRWVHANPTQSTELGFLKTGAVNDAH